MLGRPRWLQIVPESFESAMQLRLDGADRAPELSGDLFQGHACEETQEDDLAIFLWKLPDQGREDDEILTSLELALREGDLIFDDVPPHV